MADDFDLFGDIFGDAPAKNARVAGKFKPKPKFQPQRKVLAKTSVASTQAVQIVHSSLHDLSGPIETAKPFKHSSDVLANDNTKQAGQTIDSAPCEFTQPIKNAESLEYGSNAVPNDKADFHGIDGKSTEENADTLIWSEALANFSPRTNTEHAVAPSEAVALDALTAEYIGSEPHQPDNAEKASIPTFQHDAVDISSPGFTHILPDESTSELPLNEESMNIREVAQLDSCTHMGGLHDVPAKLASRRAKTGNSNTEAASDHYHQQQKASTSSQENEAIRSLRPRKGKTNFRELIDEDGDESSAAGELSGERHLSSAVDEENINNEQPQVENEPQRKILKRKSKKTENDKEKPPRKTKKAKETSEQETHAKKKKFSHSTRRRRVDKNLLNIPEDEFDPTVVSLRDLILLAEHREREMKTEQPAAGAPATQRSTGEDNDGEGSPIAGDTAEYFNYQSFMEKTPRVRWSKEDTEVFYQAVQQFGTDFSMIAQLFPGRSREQIRNKYKKEERQHPLMLRDALTNRCKDLSYFEKVIENLNKLRAKEDENADEDDYEDGAPEANDDEAKDEHVEEGENVANDSTEVQNPPLKGEGEEEEEEDDPWSHYTSEI